MCDYSLEQVASRPASVGDKLIVNRFPFGGTTGFADPAKLDMAVCVLPGTEIAFDAPIAQREHWLGGFNADAKTFETAVAVFAQLSTDNKYTHHDMLQMADGQTVLLNNLVEKQTATVLQLPKVQEMSHVELPADCEASGPVSEAPAAPYYAEVI